MLHKHFSGSHGRVSDDRKTVGSSSAIAQVETGVSTETDSAVLYGPAASIRSLGSLEARAILANAGSRV
jgi:hypothetical protein